MAIKTQEELNYYSFQFFIFHYISSYVLSLFNYKYKKNILYYCKFLLKNQVIKLYMCINNTMIIILIIL